MPTPADFCLRCDCGAIVMELRGEPAARAICHCNACRELYGSIVLAATGLIKGRRAACHWAWRDMLRLFGVIPDESRVARDGNIITGGGVTAGMDFALVVAAELAGEAFAQGLQLGLEYAPAPPWNAGRPETAPPEVLAAVRRNMEAAMPARLAQARAAAAAI